MGPKLFLVVAYTRDGRKNYNCRWQIIEVTPAKKGYDVTVLRSYKKREEAKTAFKEMKNAA